MLFVLKKVDWLRISFILIPVTTGHGNWCTCAACSKNIAPHFKEIGRKLAYIGGGWDKEWGRGLKQQPDLEVLTLSFGWMQKSNKKVPHESTLWALSLPWILSISGIFHILWAYRFDFWIIIKQDTGLTGPYCSNLLVMRCKYCSLSYYAIVLRKKEFFAAEDY